jgi:hypothetical protein
MPTFIRPSRVIVEEGGGGLAAVLVAAAAVAVLAAVLTDIVVAAAIIAALGVASSAAALIWILRRERGTVIRPPGIARTLPPAAITAPGRPAIEQRRVVPGVVVSGTITQAARAVTPSREE